MAAPVDETFRFPSGLTVEVSNLHRVVRSVWPDGAELVALPPDDPEARSRARSLGYPGEPADAVWAMTRHHDLLHHVVATAQGWPWSLVLRHAALDLPLAAAFGNQEERLVFLLQRALNAGLPGIVP